MMFIRWLISLFFWIPAYACGFISEPLAWIAKKIEGDAGDRARWWVARPFWIPAMLVGFVGMIFEALAKWISGKETP